MGGFRSLWHQIRRQVVGTWSQSHACTNVLNPVQINYFLFFNKTICHNSYGAQNENVS